MSWSSSPASTSTRSRSRTSSPRSTASSEVAVVGTPDEETGEAVLAFVVPARRRAIDEAGQDELRPVAGALRRATGPVQAAVPRRGRHRAAALGHRQGRQGTAACAGAQRRPRPPGAMSPARARRRTPTRHASCSTRVRRATCARWPSRSWPRCAPAPATPGRRSTSPVTTTSCADSPTRCRSRSSTAPSTTSGGSTRIGSRRALARALTGGFAARARLRALARSNACGRFCSHVHKLVN